MNSAIINASVVAIMRSLHPKSTPEHLKKKNSTKTADDFDTNAYFSILTNLAVKDGYTLDYVYHYIKGFGGNPCLYARPKDAKPFDTFIEYRDWAENNNLLSFLVADGTLDGFFQLAVFRLATAITAR